MLNLTDCIAGFCIVLLVTTSTLYLNVIEAGSAIRSSAFSNHFWTIQVDSHFQLSDKHHPRRSFFLHYISACNEQGVMNYSPWLKVIQGVDERRNRKIPENSSFCGRFWGKIVRIFWEEKGSKIKLPESWRVSRRASEDFKGFLVSNIQLSLLGMLPELSEDETMYQFASVVTTAMLSGIAVSLVIMVCMTLAALFHRVAMGGKQDQKTANKNCCLKLWSTVFLFLTGGGGIHRANPDPTVTS